ncbi:hypothetical protein [Cohnella mopanensis]|uniref:hypothetical protein n=1 Tax=Cohnella mopanensis TaxID=2911966 RepID=UPI001EF7FAB7|nr:hypothetical protein [Cohnella mopanensis]
MSVINEIIAIESYIKSFSPASTTGKQIVPEKPPNDSFYVRLIGDGRETETLYHFRATREYQVVYYAEWPESVIAKMDALSTALYQTEVVTPGMRMNSFGYSQPVKMRNGEIYASVGVLEVSVREARNQTMWPKINHVGIKQN